MTHFVFKFYNLVKEDPSKAFGMFRCNCGDERKFDYGIGYTNLMQHVKTAHFDMLQKIEQASGGTQILVDQMHYSPKARNLYGWMRVVIDGNHPFRIVADLVMREYMKIEYVCRNTLEKYLILICHQVKKFIRANLPPKFGLMFDGWDYDGYHLVAVFCCSPNGNFLLGIRTMQDEEHTDAPQHIELFKEILRFVYVYVRICISCHSQ